ncbi:MULTISPECIES: phospho-N-acetylmuramoyl-pentapeptide-transferase [Microbacterium]|uniref:phospho-N-acetylmuramoyl-pentapeptide- transferase n=1 Tax=Microbacterium TaxID=33882 RepID=UPI00217D68F8|nr:MULTISPECIES: phospho-N-acetylmuramoyl-pentapeptide-transferase [Microbacterium]UWF76778.1 phospho-N-acetylmuramoyl-pentapeptide-transferase [Microbacterium neungamense]WCM54928.1 phospho-N-acetylmuramoyl-pentapeptide-transferase [Microbacterium sp. EF45047]
MRSLLMATAISLAFSLFLTPVFLKLFRRLGWGQVIRTPEDIANPSHGAKRGTPTMGGLIFILGTIVGYLVGVFVGGSTPALSAILVLWLMLGFGVVGFIDDYMKVRSQRSLGLSGWRKIIGQLLVIIPFGVVALNFPNRWGQYPASSHVSLFRDIPWLDLMLIGGPILGWVLYLIWISVIGVATSNSVNLTDGLDGLAAGAGVFVVGAYSLIAFWQFKQSCIGASIAGCYEVREPLNLATVAAAFAGGLVGFLWWNAPKAKVFMGDVGSMAIGGVITAMAILTRTELLLFVIAGIFVISSGSVILQRLYFKVTRGKRLFLMSPFHHHLEMRGWPEVTIVVRLWIIAGLLAVSAVGLFYVDWLILIHA